MGIRDIRSNVNYKRDNLQDTSQTIINNIEYPTIRPTRFIRDNLGIISKPSDINEHRITRLLRKNLGIIESGGITSPGSTDPYVAQKVFNLYGANPLPLDIPSDTFIINYNQISLDLINNALSCTAASNLGFLTYSDNAISGSLTNNLALGNIFTLEFVISSSNWYIGTSYLSGVLCAKRTTVTGYLSLDYEIYLYNNTLAFLYTTTGSDYQVVSWNFTPANGTIYYVVIQRNNNDITAYINGISLGTQTLSATLYSNSFQFSLFGDGAASTNPFKIYAFRITKALRPITNNYLIYLSTVNC